MRRFAPRPPARFAPQPPARATARRTFAAATALVAVVALAACSSGSGNGSQHANAAGNGGGTTSTAAPRPAGPAADLSTELTAGKTFMGEPATVDLAKVGYEQHEYVAKGTATSYRAVGGLPENGRFHFVPGAPAAYRTRVLVRRPSDPSKFSGNVAVEWLNVSGGLDADPDWAALHEDLIRRGDAWVGVSAQYGGVEGGPVLVSAPGGEAIAGKGLKAIDPARYGSLHHPGDGWSYDIYTQVARAVRDGGAILGGAKPKHVLAVGESQSAFALVTYVDGVQPLTHAFDGFFVHSRGATPLPFGTDTKMADIAGSLQHSGPVIFRTDTDVPIIDFQTESDVAGILSSYKARQPDTDRFRLWESTGTAHADAHLLGPITPLLHCGVAVNNGPAHVIAKAAYDGLRTWIDTGRAPPRAPRLVVVPGPVPTLQRDADGIARSGIRTPPVDVPVDVLSALPGPNSSVICLLLGSTKPLPPARIAALYPSRAAYLRRYAADADRAIRAGFVLPADRAALMAYAQPSHVGG
jgi:hypothetical protein